MYSELSCFASKIKKLCQHQDAPADPAPNRGARLRWCSIHHHGSLSFQTVSCGGSSNAIPSSDSLRHPDIPDSVPLHQFMHQEQYGRYPISKSRNPFTCGLTGKSHTTEAFFSRSEYLGRSLAKRLDWTSSGEASPWERVCCVFSLNSVSMALLIFHYVLRTEAL